MRHDIHAQFLSQTKPSSHTAGNTTATNLSPQPTSTFTYAGEDIHPLAIHTPLPYTTTYPPTSHISPPPTPTTFDNLILIVWQHAFLTLSPVKFSTFTRTQIQLEAPSCPNSSGHSELQHAHITAFTHGKYQSIHDIHTCHTGIYRTLNTHVSPPILSHPDLDNILLRGIPPTSWTPLHHFDPTHAHPGTLYATSLCGIWHNGNGHVVVFYLCP